VCVSILICETIPACTCSARIAYM